MKLVLASKSGVRKKILKNHNLESSFVGHPLAKKIELEINKEKYKDQLNLDRSKFGSASIMY